MILQKNFLSKQISDRRKMKDVYILYLFLGECFDDQIWNNSQKDFSRACWNCIVYYSYHDAMSSRRLLSWPNNVCGLGLLLFGLRTH